MLLKRTPCSSSLSLRCSVKTFYFCLQESHLPSLLKSVRWQGWESFITCHAKIWIRLKMLCCFISGWAQVSQAAPSTEFACPAPGASILQGTFSGKATFLYQKDALARILLHKHCYPFEPDNCSGAFAAKATVIFGYKDVWIQQVPAAQHRAALSAVWGRSPHNFQGAKEL